MKWKLSNTYCDLPERFYSYLGVSEFPNPKLLYFNQNLADELGIKEDMAQFSEEEKAQLFCGNLMLENTPPIALAYAGHQFAYFNMLGDGRAKLLGEWRSFDSDDFETRFDIQLKGSGRTPYSRGGDGRATIASVLREYLISEAMHRLGVPTTRSLAVVLTGEKIYREGYSDGAVLTRVAKSHLRVGTFQFARTDEPSDVIKLCEYAIDRHYPHLKSLPVSGREGRYLAFLAQVAQRQAQLIANWQLLGFVHGVMNTDNMSICGETIDYGPCAFMDVYNPMTVFSSIDTTGRYRYENQPIIGKWNLARLAEALFEVIDEEEELAITWINEILSEYDECFETHWLNGMRKKLGIDFINPALYNEQARHNEQGQNTDESISCEALKHRADLKEEAHKIDMDDRSLIKTLLHLMQINKADFTNTFIRLTKALNSQDACDLEGTDDLFSDPKFFKWTQNWKKRQNMSGLSDQELYKGMKQVNPYVIPRNHLVEDALLAFEAGNFEVFEAFFKVLEQPYDYDADVFAFQKIPPNSMRNYKTYCGT